MTSLTNFSINQVNEIILLQRPWISTMEVIFYLGGTQHYRKIGRSRKVLLLVYGCSVLIQRAFWSGMIEHCCILIVLFGPIKITGCFFFCLLKKLLCLETRAGLLGFLETNVYWELGTSGSNTTWEFVIIIDIKNFHFLKMFTKLWLDEILLKCIFVLWWSSLLWPSDPFNILAKLPPFGARLGCYIL